LLIGIFCFWPHTIVVNGERFADYGEHVHHVLFAELTEVRLAGTVAGSSRRSSDSTTLRRSGTLNLDFAPIFQLLSIFVNPTH